MCHIQFRKLYFIITFKRFSSKNCFLHIYVVDGRFPYCGGTIIGPSTILTAAHCLHEVPDTDRIKVKVSEHDVTTSYETITR